MQQWEMAHRLRELIAVVMRVVFDWQVHPVAHEIDVPKNGLFGHFDLLGELAAVGVIASPNPFEDFVNPVKRGAIEVAVRPQTFFSHVPVDVPPLPVMSSQT